MQFTKQDARKMLYRFAGIYTLVSIVYDVLNAWGIAGFEQHPSYFTAMIYTLILYFADLFKLQTAG
ncbi:MAG: hypothetical protein KGS48_15575 [Bacteroidetes bacterium]|nr:hypothetical protein [Bacteroidota bacterium]